MRPLSSKETSRRSPPSPERLGARRRRLRMIGVLATIVALVAAAYGASWASYLPKFSVQDIRVTGANEVSTNLLHAYIETKLHDGQYAFFSRSNIFLYPRNAIERAIVEYFPRIKSAKVSRESLLATAITVSIEERGTFAKWCNKEECYFLGENGFIFAPSTPVAPTLSPYLFRGGISSTTSAIGQQYLPGNFAGVLALLERLGQTGFSPSEVVAKDDQDFSIRLQEGFEIRVSYGADVGALVKNLELILTSEPLKGSKDELEYVDLRFGNRVYYKFKGSTRQSANAP